MKRQIFLGIGLLVLLLPFINSATPYAVNAIQDNPIPSSPELNAVVSGDKIVYNITKFQYGDGIWDILDMLLEQTGVPSFDKGIIGTLEGTELITYIGYVDDLTLYQWNDITGGYFNATVFNAMQIFSFLKLNQELGVYADASQFSFPDDFRKTDYSYYHDYWPYANFRDPIGEDFWSNFNGSFYSGFSNGWYEADQSWGFSAWWPNEGSYGSDSITWFASDLGYYIGYSVAYNGYYESSADPAWDDSASALNGFYTGFHEAWEEGFLQGRLDFNATKIPDKRYSGMLPSPVNVYDFGRYMEYGRWYEMFYSRGFRYEGAKIDFNWQLYNDLYDAAHNTYWKGYQDGFSNYYWMGQNDGYWHNSFNYYTPYYDPRGAYEEGYNIGSYDGYSAGYDDGWYSYSVGEQYMHGLESYSWNSYFDGFDVGAADKLASQPYDSTPASLPFSPSTVDPYEQGANFMYDNQYREGYDNGYKYATLVLSANDLDWLWHAGPFYYMTLPYFEFTLDPNSIIPTPLMSMTMLSNLTAIMENNWEFNYQNHDYWPFSDNIIPMQTFYAGDTDWVSMGSYYKYRDEDGTTEETIGTYDDVNDFFTLEFKLNASQPGVSMNVTWGYDTATGYLVNVTCDLNFYSMEDVWASAIIELEPAKADNISPVMPTPSSWTYSINNFVFYFDVPPTADPDFVDGVVNFKMNGLSAVGNPLLGVHMTGYDGLYAFADTNLYNPTNTSQPPEAGEYIWPIFSPQGFQWATDYELYDGAITTVNSIFGATSYIESALSALSLQNTNFNLYDLDLNLGAHKFRYTGMGNPIIYYYVTVDASIDLQWSMLNGDYQWETQTEEGWIRGTIWIGIDELTGVVIGAGAKTSFDFEVSQTPDYGMNGGILTAYLEIMIGSTFRALPDLYSVLGGLPAVPEYTLISILTILGFAAVASAVIFIKKR